MKKTDTPAFHKLCRLAGQAVGRFRMIADGDRILVGLSGGKDSMVSMDQAILALQREGMITKETALMYADHPEQMKRNLD